MRIDNPTVLVSRPDVDAHRFVEQLSRVAGPFNAVISPAFSYERRDDDLPVFDAAVFTSKTGVKFAPMGNGRRAYCVGNATAKAAMDAGYDAISANGSADDLFALILEQQPVGVLSHMHGEVSFGDISARLTTAGLSCADVILYRKVWLLPSKQAMGLQTIMESVVIPVFSAETASILAQWPVSFAGCAVVAISDAVARASKGLGHVNITVSDAPNMASMALATARMIA